MKPGVFIMNGIDSEYLSTYIQDRPLIDVPQRKIEWKEGRGVDGSIPFDEGAYHNTVMEFLTVTNGIDLIGDRQALVNVMDTKGSYGEFIPYFDPLKVYRVMLGEKMSFENKRHYGNVQVAKIIFTVKPYKYLIDSPEKIVTGKTTMINPTNYVSQPLMRVEGSGDVEIIVNGIKFGIRNLPNKITIDGERYLAYTEGPIGPLESMNGRITSREYPIFKPGSNVVDFTGSVTKIAIEPRWRSLV